MKFRLTHLLAVAAACGMVSAASIAQAYPASVGWTIDSSQSFLSLSIPDQTAQINSTLAFPIRVRNQSGSASVWNQGNTSPLTGTINTTVVSDTLGSISFDPGSAISGLNSGTWRPDPASWNGTAFTNTNAVPQDYGNQILVNIGLGFGQLGLSTLDQVLYGILSGAIGVNTNGGLFASTIPNTGVTDVVTALDVTNAVLLGAGLTDSFDTTNGIPLQQNGFGNPLPPASIANNGGNLRTLTLPLLLPFAFDAGASTVTGYFLGQVVATASIPEPSTLALAGLGAVGLALLARRRARRR
ncbi:MAG: PEP-CTERM sorting domain-containing protein [Planctomycetia bacterium]|nr:PEP-CTERM sorting domain-containing protein [Planctomycetia bacterium]